MKEKLTFVFLISLGLAQIAGDLLNITELKAFAAASGASPAPKVFTAHKGFETYSSNYYIEWITASGELKSLQLTPAIYRNIKGPYNRRNAYGAAIAYAPILDAEKLTRPLLESVSKYAFCGDAPMLKALGIDKKEISGAITIQLVPRQALPIDHNWRLTYEVTCDA